MQASKQADRQAGRQAGGRDGVRKEEQEGQEEQLEKGVCTTNTIIRRADGSNSNNRTTAPCPNGPLYMRSFEAL
jgi:hypothetical protein